MLTGIFPSSAGSRFQIPASETNTQSSWVKRLLVVSTPFHSSMSKQCGWRQPTCEPETQVFVHIHCVSCVQVDLHSPRTMSDLSHTPDCRRRCIRRRRWRNGLGEVTVSGKTKLPAGINRRKECRTQAMSGRSFRLSAHLLCAHTFCVCCFFNLDSGMIFATAGIFTPL